MSFSGGLPSQTWRMQKAKDSCFLKNGKMLSDHKIYEKILPVAQFTETFWESAVQMRGQILA